MKSRILSNIRIEPLTVTQPDAINNAEFGVKASHPDYPEIIERGSQYRNRNRNRDLALIRILSRIADFERHRADAANGPVRMTN